MNEKKRIIRLSRWNAERLVDIMVEHIQMFERDGDRTIVTLASGLEVPVTETPDHIRNTILTGFERGAWD